MSHDIARSVVVDTLRGFVYIGVQDAGTGKIIKVRTSDFTEVASLTVSASPLIDSIYAMAIDVTGGFIYGVGINSGSSVGFKVNVQNPTFSTVTVDFGATLSGTFNVARLDVPNDFVYFGGTGQVVKFALASFGFAGQYDFGGIGTNQVSAGVLDLVAAQGYFYAANGRIYKVPLSTFNSNTFITPAGVGVLNAAEIDTGAGFVYFGSGDSPAKVVKVTISSFTVASTLTLNGGDNDIRCSFIDTPNARLYFGTHTTPGRAVKVRLGSFDEALSVPFNTGEDLILSGGADLPNLIGYFGTDQSPAKLLKVSLNPAEYFQIKGQLLLEAHASEKISGTARLEVVATGKITGTCELTFRATELIGGTTDLHIVATDKIKGKILLEGSATDSIAGTETLEARLADSIEGEVSVEAVVTEPIKGISLLQGVEYAPINAETFLEGVAYEPIIGTASVEAAASALINSITDVVFRATSKIAGGLLLQGTNFTGEVVDQFSPNQNGDEVTPLINLTNWVAQGFVPTLRNVKRVFLLVNSASGSQRYVYLTIRNNKVQGLENVPDVDISPIVQEPIDGNQNNVRLSFEFDPPVPVMPGQIYHLAIRASQDIGTVEPTGYTLAPASLSVDGGASWINVP